MMQLTHASIAYLEYLDVSEKTELALAKEQAQGALSSILKSRKIVERGQWENWHRG